MDLLGEIGENICVLAMILDSRQMSMAPAMQGELQGWLAPVYVLNGRGSAVNRTQDGSTYPG
jgi:hypothetical protein